MGTIGVRCAASHTSLWFHLDVQVATGHLHPDFRTDGRDRELNRLLGQQQPWDELTDVGRRIFRRVLRIRSVVWLSARPDYFDLQIRHERFWRRVLPAVVKVIREETEDPQARVKPHRNKWDRSPQWHVPLLRELF